MTISLARAVSTWTITAGLAIGAAHAWAAPPAMSSLDPPVIVKFDDLKLETSEGTRVLYERLGAAAHAVCGMTASWDPRVYYAQRDCYRATLDRTVARLNLPLLTALHHARAQHASEAPRLQARNR